MPTRKTLAVALPRSHATMNNVKRGGPMAGHIFISHAHANGAYVNRLAAHLARNGVTVWMEDQIPSGERWRRVLKQQIRSCRALLVVMTPDAGASRWVRKEVRYARRLGKTIMPLLLDGDIILGLDAIQAERVVDHRMPSAWFIDRLRGLAPRARVLTRQIGAVPEGAGRFVHRALAGQLDQALTDDARAIRTGGANTTRILSGLGGVGKTQLAAYVARARRDEADVDALIWIAGTSRDAILSGYARAAHAIIGADSTYLEQAARELLNHLATTTGTWMVVVDDLTHPSDLDGWWPPRTATGHAIVTTRRTDAALSSHGTVMTVDVFTPGEAIAYLSVQLPRQALSQAEELAADLGYLPVALAQAAAYISDRNLTCADYRDRLSDRATTLLQLAPDARPDDYARPVAVTLGLSIVAADDLPPVGLSRPLLELISLLDANGVPRTVLTAEPAANYLARHQPPDQRTDPTEAPITPHRVDEAIACLARLSLANTGSNDGLALVSAHALVQRAARDLTPPVNRADAARAVADALLLAWPDVEGGSPIGQLLRANTATLRIHAEEHLWNPDPHPVLRRYGLSLGESGQVAAAVDYFRYLAATAAQRLGPDHPETLSMRLPLAGWQGEAGDATGALAELEQLLADRIRVLDPGDELIMTTRGNLAYWRGQSGDVAGAAAAFDVLLGDCLREVGPDHEYTISTRGNLAYWRGQAGDAAGAVEAFEQLLADCLRVAGADHPGTLNTRHYLNYWRAQAGDIAGAVEAFEVLLADRIRLIGPDHPGTLSTRGNLARWRGEAGDAVEAADKLEQLLTVYLRVLGPDHPDTLNTRAYLADMHGLSGDVVGAIAEFERILTDRERILGTDHPDSRATRKSIDRWRRQNSTTTD